MLGSKGIRYSAILHGVMLLLLIFGLPSFLERPPEPEPMAFSVDILPIAPISNVKPQEKAPEKPEPKKPEVKETKRKPTPEAHKEEPKKTEEPLPTPVKKPEVKKPEPKKEPKKQEKKKEESLDDILKSVKDSAKSDESKKPTEKKAPRNQHEAKSDRFDPASQISMSEKDAIRQQIEQRWSPPAGAKDAYNLSVTLMLELQEDGSVTSVELSKDKGRYNSDSFFRSAVDSAIRAVKMASPLKNLPSGKYEGWRTIEMTFDPRDMLY